MKRTSFGPITAVVILTVLAAVAAPSGLRLVQTGPLAAPVWLLMGRLVRRYVDLEAEGLRRRAESG